MEAYKLDGLRFDNPNNGALSLRLLAEFVRSGDVRILRGSTDGGVIRLELAAPAAADVKRVAT